LGRVRKKKKVSFQSYLPDMSSKVRKDSKGIQESADSTGSSVFSIIPVNVFIGFPEQVIKTVIVCMQDIIFLFRFIKVPA
jgi:hypothetical protein